MAREHFRVEAKAPRGPRVRTNGRSTVPGICAERYRPVRGPGDREIRRGSRIDRKDPRKKKDRNISHFRSLSAAVEVVERWCGLAP